MICKACREARHHECMDAKPGTEKVHDGKRYVVPVREDRDYRSCFCQHAPSIHPEPATGPAGE